MTFYKKSEKERARKKNQITFPCLNTYIRLSMEMEKKIGKENEKYVGIFKNRLKFFEPIEFLESEKDP